MKFPLIDRSVSDIHDHEGYFPRLILLRHPRSRPSISPVPSKFISHIFHTPADAVEGSLVLLMVRHILLCIHFVLLVPPFIPLRILALVEGLTPLVLSCPIMRFQILSSFLPQFINSKPFRNQLTRLIDDDELEYCHWASEMNEVEL